ncbi:hypothetical protein [Streptococcus caballi]|uniref:hypothetical protein n=1 Tax=Streptococcus caballi TaxID=439220 RepID=UPI00035C0A64|nr:hypothetical protein [Streptococcus caballi]
MVSYEKIRQSLRSFTVLLQVIYFLTAIFGVLSVIGVFLLKANINSEAYTSQYSSQQLEILRQSITPFAIFLLCVSLAASILIIVFNFINLSKIKKKDEISYLPFYLGAVLALINIVSNLLTAKAQAIGLLIQIAILAINFYAFTRAKMLNEHDD